MGKRNKLLAAPLYLQILLGMIIGIIVGLVALYVHAEAVVQDWITPWGQLFIRLLQLIAVPLIFISLVKGITGLKDVSKFSKLGGRTLLLYFIFITVAVAFGIGLGLIVKPGALVDPAAAADMQDAYQSTLTEKTIAAEQLHDEGPLRFLKVIVPDNIIAASSNNANMLQVIFFAILFGLAALMIPRQVVKPVIDLFDGLNDIIMKMVSLIIGFAPIGVLALMAAVVTDSKGNVSVFSALGLYAVTVIAAMLMIMFIFYPLIIKFFSKHSAKKFIRAMYPVQLFAFTTSSSAVTLPVTMKAVTEELHISEEVTSFVCPVGVTVNMDGTSCYQSIAILFIAQVLGVDLNFSQIMTVLFMTVLSSLGTPGIPGGSFVILTLVLTSVGIPAEGMALIMGIDRPLDMLRTSVNVTGDAVVACMVDQK